MIYGIQTPQLAYGMRVTLFKLLKNDKLMLNNCVDLRPLQLTTTMANYGSSRDYITNSIIIIIIITLLYRVPTSIQLKCKMQMLLSFYIN